MRIIIRFISLILFNQLLTRVAYGSVNMFLGSSFCQRIIQQDVANAVKNVCTAVNVIDPYEVTTAKLQTVEGKVDDALAKLGYLQSTISKIARPCPTGFEYYEQESLCYKFHSECKTWSEARQICKDEGGDLISLTEGNLNNFRDVSRKRAGTCTHVWVGTTDISSAGKWNWLNGREITSVFWSPDQPDNWANKEHCGDLVKVSDYLLNDEDCSIKLHFLCQRV